VSASDAQGTFRSTGARERKGLTRRRWVAAWGACRNLGGLRVTDAVAFTGVVLAFATPVAAYSAAVKTSPSSVAIGHSFKINVHGVATQKALLYVYLDHERCRKAWSAEAKRINRQRTTRASPVSGFARQVRLRKRMTTRRKLLFCEVVHRTRWRHRSARVRRHLSDDLELIWWLPDHIGAHLDRYAVTS